MTMTLERKHEILAELLDVSKKQSEYREILDQVLTQAGQIRASLESLESREKELGAELAGGEIRPAKETRKYLNRESKLELHRIIHATMRSLDSRGMEEMPIEAIVRAVQTQSEEEEGTIKRQIKALAESDRSPVEHNGMRGMGSLYRIREE